jgi:hypothetical protein
LLEQNKIAASDKGMGFSKVPQLGPFSFYRQLLRAFSATE